MINILLAKNNPYFIRMLFVLFITIFISIFFNWRIQWMDKEWIHGWM